MCALMPGQISPNKKSLATITASFFLVSGVYHHMKLYYKLILITVELINKYESLYL